MNQIDFNTVIWKEGDHYVSQCLEVDVSSFGDTKEEALDNLHEALQLYFEDVKIPQKTKVEDPVIASVTLQNA